MKGKESGNGANKEISDQNTVCNAIDVMISMSKVPTIFCRVLRIVTVENGNHHEQ
jgi:hypothetical protein